MENEKVLDIDTENHYITVALYGSVTAHIARAEEKEDGTICYTAYAPVEPEAIAVIRGRIAATAKAATARAYWHRAVGIEEGGDITQAVGACIKLQLRDHKDRYGLIYHNQVAATYTATAAEEEACITALSHIIPALDAEKHEEDIAEKEKEKAEVKEKAEDWDPTDEIFNHDSDDDTSHDRMTYLPDPAERDLYDALPF